MSATSKARSRAAIVAVAPAALMAAFFSHPHIPGRLPNDAAVAAAVVANPTHWGLSHLGLGVASGLIAVAFLFVYLHLRASGEAEWGGTALGFVIVGSTLYAVLPGMEFAPLAAARTGADVEAAQAALGPWFVPLLATAAVTFAVGAVRFAVGIVRSGVLNAPLGIFVAGALVVMAASRIAPFTAIQFQVQALAALAAFWPLAYVMWRSPEGIRAQRTAIATAS